MGIQITRDKACSSISAEAVHARIVYVEERQ